MRLHSATLGVFVPGWFSVPQNPVGARRGTGDFVRGRFTVPQNPVVVDMMRSRRGTGEFVMADYTLPQNPITAGLAGFVPTAAMYPIVPNTVLEYYQEGGINYGDGLTGLSGLGCGCGCGGSCGGDGGLGDISTDLQQVAADLSNAIANPTVLSNWQPFLTDPILSIPVWGWGAGLIAAVMLLSGGGHKRRRR